MLFTLFFFEGSAYHFTKHIELVQTKKVFWKDIYILLKSSWSPEMRTAECNASYYIFRSCISCGYIDVWRLAGNRCPYKNQALNMPQGQYCTERPTDFLHFFWFIIIKLLPTSSLSKGHYSNSVEHPSGLTKYITLIYSLDKYT